MKLGIYGGAFNPVHYGHLRTAQEVSDILFIDKILFVPSGRTPFDKPDLAKACHRHEMVKAAIRGNRHFDVSDIEVRRRGKSYTVDTLKSLRSTYRGCELFFILGIDAFLDLAGWKQPDILIDLADLVVISRPGHTFTGLSSSSYLKKVSGKTLRDLDTGKTKVFSFSISARHTCHLCSVTGLNISASQIRNLVSSGKTIKYLLPDSVKSYIISNKLYKGEAGKRSEKEGRV